MHDRTIEKLSQQYQVKEHTTQNEGRLLKVTVLTAVTMVIEIAAGHLTGSMALLADGWHMGTHAFALGISYLAYLLARKHALSEVFSFGTGKFTVLGGYTSALFLGLAAIWMIKESFLRTLHPVPIAFTEAIGVTVVGLVVNLISVVILHRTEDHSHDHGHEKHHQHDHSYRAAYLHVIADILTSILALVALISGRYLGWAILDPLMGIVGGLLIARWAAVLLWSSGMVLVDGGIDRRTREHIRQRFESDKESRVADLHVWRIGSKEIAVTASVVCGTKRGPEEYRSRLQEFPGLAYLLVEVHPCEDRDCSCIASGSQAKIPGQ